MLTTTTMHNLHNAHVQSSESMHRYNDVHKNNICVYTSVCTVSIRIIAICIYMIIHAYVFLLYTIFPRYHLRAQLQKHHTTILPSHLQSRDPRQWSNASVPLFELQHSLKLSRLACPPNGVKLVMIHDLCGGLGFMKRRTVPHCPTLAKGQTQRQERGQTARLAQAEVPRDYQKTKHNSSAL